MIFSIRTKLLLYFFVLILLMSSVALFFYQSSQRTIREYDESFASFLLLNETSQQTKLVMDTWQAYFARKEQRYLDDYQKEKEKLLKMKAKLSSLQRPDESVIMDSYPNMLESFVTESDMAIRSFHGSQISDYYMHVNQATKIAGFIQESTLSLLNRELNNYQKFHDDIEERNQLFGKMTLPLFISTFLLSSLIAFWISGGITRPISRLSKAAGEIAKGNFSGEEVPVTTKDELKPLTETFNQMRMNISELIIEIKQKSELDKLLKEFELRSLQNQINPHFLFNTLNTVSKMAYLEDAEKTTRLIEAVSALLRYNLGHADKPTSLKKEVDVVKEYFYIQKTRFGERIQFATDIEEECLDMYVPSLILQPLVENAFVHGVESYEEGAIISLSIFKRNNSVWIEVSDNGVGMDAVTRNRLLKFIAGQEQDDPVQTQKSGGTGIGVRNVIRRLQIFDEGARIEIESELEGGTLFRLMIPYAKDGGIQLAKSINS
ncbi:sensor histidine kinase [Peribacillus sp. SCS-155]|uniref:sensor histidine kinase n=1 Tax=Peribacillus sedimenti TaxID=3115297 RepID=UPI00390581FF